MSYPIEIDFPFGIRCIANVMRSGRKAARRAGNIIGILFKRLKHSVLIGPLVFVVNHIYLRAFLAKLGKTKAASWISLL